MLEDFLYGISNKISVYPYLLYIIFYRIKFFYSRFVESWNSHCYLGLLYYNIILPYWKRDTNQFVMPLFCLLQITSAQWPGCHFDSIMNSSMLFPVMLLMLAAGLREAYPSGSLQLNKGMPLICGLGVTMTVPCSVKKIKNLVQQY